jgi:hypothetical protein
MKSAYFFNLSYRIFFSKQFFKILKNLKKKKKKSNFSIKFFHITMDAGFSARFGKGRPSLTQKLN